MVHLFEHAPDDRTVARLVAPTSRTVVVANGASNTTLTIRLPLAAVIAGTITDDMIRAAVAEGQFGDPRAEEFLVRAISERRVRILQTYLPKVNPIAEPALDRNGRLTFRNLAAQEITLDKATLGRHYEEHVGKGFYGELVQFMSRGPVVALAIEGPQDTWEVVRGMMGATNPRKAAPGTIRGDLGILFTENLVHGSDGPESAAREIALFFPALG